MLRDILDTIVIFGLFICCGLSGTYAYKRGYKHGKEGKESEI